MSEYILWRGSQQFCLRVSLWGATCRSEFTRTHTHIYIYSTATSGNNNAPCFSNSGSNPFQPVPSTYSCGTFGGRYSSFTSMSSPGIPNGSLWLPGQSTHGEKTWNFFCSHKWPSRPIEMRKINK